MEKKIPVVSFGSTMTSNSCIEMSHLKDFPGSKKTRLRTSGVVFLRLSEHHHFWGLCQLNAIDIFDSTNKNQAPSHDVNDGDHNVRYEPRLQVAFRNGTMVVDQLSLVQVSYSRGVRLGGVSSSAHWIFVKASNFRGKQEHMEVF